MVKTDAELFESMSYLSPMHPARGRNLIPRGGNDKVYTPDALAKRIVGHFAPTGVLLEPCYGKGAFKRALGDTALGCELDDGSDFFDFTTKVDWIVTNPPFSKHRAFLKHSMELAEHIVFLCPINAFFLKARLRDIDECNFFIQEMIFIDTPKEFPQSGFQMGVTYISKRYTDKIKVTDWRGT